MRPLARRGSGGRGRRASGEGARDEGSRNKSLFPVSRSSCTQTTLACSPCLDVFRVYCTRSNCRNKCRKMSLLMYLSQQPDARKSVLMKPHATCTTQIACG